MALENGFHKIPPEIWDKIVPLVSRRDLVSLALVSKNTYPHANLLLYKTLEVSFCKCSLAYYDALARTILNSPELAALVTTLYIDMKVPCQVKTASSLEDVKSTNQWKRQFRIRLDMLPGRGQISEEPKGHIEWNREVVQTLQNPQLLDILPTLISLQKITVILGHFQHDPEILSALVNVLPSNVISNVHYLKIYDSSLVKTPSITHLSHLRSLVLGYVNVQNADLCFIVAQNSKTLEELRLNWIVEVSQSPLFSNYSGPTLENLKVLALRGPQPFSLDGIRTVLGSGQSLEEIGLESLSAPTALAWAQILVNLRNENSQCIAEMRSVRFGAPNGCGEFWDSVAQFLCHCGSCLNTLSINGSPRGPVGAFPPALFNYFLKYTQPNLSDLILIWRDDVGLAYDAALSLGMFCPSVNLLHVSLCFPPGKSDNLLSLISPFIGLRRLHLTFLSWPMLAVMSSALRIGTPIDTSDDITQNGPLFQQFIKGAVARHPDLDEVSWSIYDRLSFSAEEPKTYVKVNLQTKLVHQRSLTKSLA
ncbi:hypothetical protein EW145_g4648 [Phellinidium pouzarii]|uniref:F-box domain-containing protein n=1 Tax=Phellinidium pouzarii TaxID=167371 RepID=A0A4S4L2X3_9AGAM|nr:hypothetical protein EW145_g4648 [Phellinidium pouzarii]